MMNDINKDAQERMNKSLETLMRDLEAMKVGRARLSLLDGVRVPAYGDVMPLSQMASITVENNYTLKVAVHDRSLMREVEQAILASGLNLTDAGASLLINIPSLTEERRKGHIKQARGIADKARSDVSNAHQHLLVELKTLSKDKKISEDEEHRAAAELRKLTDGFVSKIDKMLSEKESELMEL